MTHSETTRVYLGIGSNLGDRLHTCQQAVAALQLHPHIHLIQVSSLYETTPVDYEQQGAFYNAVLALDTSLSAMALLQVCQDIERGLDKKITIAKGPRTIDLDLLFYGTHINTDPVLILPHPEISNRLFVLVPLAEIAPEWAHVTEGCTVHKLLDHFSASTTQSVKKCFEPGWEQTSQEPITE